MFDPSGQKRQQMLYPFGKRHMIGRICDYRIGNVEYPGCQYADSKHSDKYNKMMIEIYGGEGNNDLEKENKIIKNITKDIIIDR